MARNRWGLTPRGQTPLALAFLVVLSGCATIYNPATQRHETLLSTPVEIAIGNIARTQMGLFSLQMGKIDPNQLARVQTIGQQIAEVSDRKDVPYRFGAIQKKSLNAFALPGGTIYVHSGLAEKASDDELAAVIAHEVGHVAARHAAKHLQADLGFTLLVQIAAATGADPASGQVANSIYGLLRNGYSRQDELEADRLGLHYADRAGYNPDGMVTFFEKMLEEDPEDPLSRATVWQRTHPLASDRIQKAKEEIARLRQEPFCPTCGRIYPVGVKFCEKDGAALAVRGEKS